MSPARGQLGANIAQAIGRCREAMVFGGNVASAELGFTDLMQGGCPTGVDSFAHEWATTKPEIQRYVCHAHWGKYV